MPVSGPQGEKSTKPKREGRPDSASSSSGAGVLVGLGIVALLLMRRRT